MPATRGLRMFSPTRATVRREYSGLIALMFETRERTNLMSSSMKDSCRPVPKPCHGLVVRPGQTMAICSPMPCMFTDICRLKPIPNATRTTIATVPQMMPNIVRNARSFCARRSTINSVMIVRNLSMKKNLLITVVYTLGSALTTSYFVLLTSYFLLSTSYFSLFHF